MNENPVFEQNNVAERELPGYNLHNKFVTGIYLRITEL